MFEVLVTYRPDFHEKVVERCATIEEAQTRAEHILAQLAPGHSRLGAPRAWRQSESVSK